MNSIEVVYLIITIALMVLIGLYAIKTRSVVRWLEYAVLVCEQELGKKTGQAKLRMAYDMFLDKFPFFSAIMPFSIFSKLVDLALEWLNVQLKSNKTIKGLVDGE